MRRPRRRVGILPSDRVEILARPEPLPIVLQIEVTNQEEEAWVVLHRAVAKEVKREPPSAGKTFAVRPGDVEPQRRLLPSDRESRIGYVWRQRGKQEERGSQERIGSFRTNHVGGKIPERHDPDGALVPGKSLLAPGAHLVDPTRVLADRMRAAASLAARVAVGHVVIRGITGLVRRSDGIL